MARGSDNGKVAMRVTAIRIGPDVWRVLDAEAARAGVSVSQYMREAALARAAAAAAARGEDPLALLGEAAAAGQPQAPKSPARAKGPGSAAEQAVASATRTTDAASRHRAQAQHNRDDAAAVVAESIQARRRSKQIGSKRERPLSD
jgi:hypothetical protein